MKKLTSLFTKKTIILLFILLCTAAAGAYGLALKHKEKEERPEMVWHDDFRNSFFESDIFAEMEAMEKQMDKAFEEHRKIMKKMMHSENLSSKNSLALFQDEKSYRYELTFDSFKKEDVMVSVDNRVMTVSAAHGELKKDKKKGELRSSNNLFYSLTIPQDAVGNPEIKREEGKIVIKFAKEMPSK